MTLKEICEQLESCDFQCVAGNLQTNLSFIELERLAELDEESCIFDGLADNSIPSVKSVLSCYLGKRVRVSIVELRAQQKGEREQ